MTVTDFYMDVSNGYFTGEKVVEITAKDGDMGCSFEVSLEDMNLGLSDIFDYLGEFLKKELLPRAENLWDESRITDKDLESFKSILKMIL